MLKMKKCSSTLYLLHIPWPCTGDVESQRSKTWRQQRGSQQRLGCLAPQMPAGSGSLEPGFDDWSFSWQNAGGSPCGVPDTQPFKKPHYICYPYELIITESTGKDRGRVSMLTEWKLSSSHRTRQHIAVKLVETPFASFLHNMFDRKVKIGYWQHNNI